MYFYDSARKLNTASGEQKRVLIRSNKQFDDGEYMVEISIVGRKMFITAVSEDAQRKFLVEVPEAKGILFK